MWILRFANMAAFRTFVAAHPGEERYHQESGAGPGGVGPYFLSAYWPAQNRAATCNIDSDLTDWVGSVEVAGVP